MRKPLVAGNWKMHGSRGFVASHLESLKTLLAGVSVETAVFPPAVYLSLAATLLEQGPRVISLGAQNLSTVTDEGAFTGEVCGAMLRDVGCRFVLVGHSERRTVFGESSAEVADKFSAALQAGLIPLLCVGETLADRQSGSTRDVVREQINAVVDRVGLESVASAVIAYEPVWAIGTGLTASPAQAQEVHAAIREQLGAPGELTRILYGGSVKAANAGELFSQPDIDGGLIGGASLIADEFAAICRQADQR
ncbi:MAG: triosephosphate isomerase [Gammaproteobacteria bacterium BRH_c0]|nr:MAG: triosephosphate isomerase [Gammaproteobacteria bacterium BRH_c0]